MDMVRVDPKLFITCRLCLVETGTYQVTPTVAEEIEYCFSIIVDQYDGLPQLICEKCQKILNEYTTLKKTFVGRQNALKTQLQIRKEVQETLAQQPPQQEAVSSSQQAEDDVDDDLVVQNHLKAKRRKSRFISSSSSASSDRHTSRSSSLLTERCRSQKRKTTSREPWEEFFNKRLACKICNRHVKTTSNLTNHLKVHADIISEHKHILDRPCEVRLIKLDTQPNLTGRSNTVVLRNDKIISKQKVNGFIIYTPKENAHNIVIENNKEQEQETQDKGEAEAEKVPQSSGDDSDFEIKNNNHKRPRLLSTDTVVLNDDYKSSTVPDSIKKVIQNDAEIECIDLDDSSNSSTQTNDGRAKDSMSLVQPKDIEAIKNIIKVCHSKYIDRKNKMSEWNTQPNISKNKDPHLKAKLLSMGRKIIKNEGLVCTGLLRFMQHKNLAVKWIPNVGRSKTSKEGNYVRIMPRLKGRHELIADNTGWKNRILQKKTSPAPPEPSEDHERGEAFHESIDESSQCVEDSVPANDLPDVALTTVSDSNNVMTSPTFVGAVERRSLPVLLIPDLIVKPEDNKILLNANPVANPKQLPKKSVIPESKMYIQASISSIAAQNGTFHNENNQENICVDLVETTEETAEMCMPIITSTTSLSTCTPANDDKDKDVDMNAVTSTEQSADKPAPFRLKVKPVSEINSAINCKTVLSENNNRTGPSENVWTFTPDQIHINLVAPTTTAAPRPVATAAPVQAIMEIPDEDSQDSYGSQRNNHTLVIMDTVELPNTKTNSPFRYVKDLLKIHNIVVMEPTDFISGGFTCLIKFKLQIQRNANQSPLTLCLSVHCKDNMFYLGVKDPNSATNLDLNKLPANWQWEILKIYKTRDDVKAKMTQNAQKHGQSMYSNTQNFLCVLKSITFKSTVNDT